MRIVRNVNWVVCTLVTVFLCGAAMADPKGSPPAPAGHESRAASKPAAAASQASEASPAESNSPVVTHHSMLVGGAKLDYTATAGFLTIRDEAGKVEADVFYTAYAKDGQDASKRPIVFAFNGGPGAASLWLHLGAMGPRRLVLPQDGTVLVRSPKLVDNEYTWLEFADLVFVDPIGSGYSQAAPGVDAKQFFGVEGDIRSLGEFIRLYVAKNDRWLSPKFLAGESYGTTRSAGLARHLQRSAGISCRGLVLISSALNFQTFVFAKGNDVPCVLYLPTYTAIAWYHNKLSADLQKDLPKALAEAERWATDEYGPALARGSELPPADRAKIVKGLHRFTSLPEKFIEASDLRISNHSFAKELLRDEQKLVGFLDGRVVGHPIDPASTHMDYDPAIFLVIEPFVSAIQNYLRKELGYVTEKRYEYLSGAASQAWNWGSAAGGYVNVTDDLQAAMSADYNLKVFAAMGYFDLTTGYFAQKYMMTHVGLVPALQGNIQQVQYPSGHQIYNHLPSLKQMNADVRLFVNAATAEGGREAK